MQTVTIENKFLSVKARIRGGALTSVIDKTANEELLYQPRPDSWDDQDIVIFPFIARLKDFYYELNGKRYDMEIHGVARSNDFAVERQTADSVTLLLRDSEATRKIYPFPFELRVTYRVEGKKLYSGLHVKNPGAAELPFMVGGHPGYRLDCDERPDKTDTSGNFLVLPRNKHTYLTLDASGGYIKGEAELTGDTFELSKDFFVKYNTLMLRDFEGALELRKRSRTLRFELGRVPVLALWAKPDFGDYVCVEPWYGRPDDETPVREFADKPLMNRLAPGAAFDYEYSMELA